MLIRRILVSATPVVGVLGIASEPPPADMAIAKTGGGGGEVLNNTAPSAGSDLLARDDIPPHDCEDILRRAITLEIDCSYSWENCGFDNHLEYRIRINAIGKTSPKWCEMMFHLVQRAINYHIRQEECDRTYRSDENGNGMVVVVTLPKPIPKFGEWRLNVEQAIRDNFCAGGPELTYWVNERCYRTSICRNRYWKRSLNPRLSGSLPETMSPAKERDRALFGHAAPITATTVSVEPAATNAVPRDEPAPIVVNRAATAAGSGADGKTEEGPGPVGRCPDPADEEHACGGVDKSLVGSVGVHCSYTRGRGDDANRLDYRVTVNPTGQDTACWCGRLMAAVRARCPQGQADWAYPLLKCDGGHARNELGGGGIHVNFHSNAWVAGKDNRECVRAAIESTTCGVATHFDRGGCFENR
ncbi:hypothetical protein LX36DRAFT_754084 [Colletotrichum falcatum]|nr:hypothetical protein LX36DRAFT_754084 [Colletotrichum falcatum]